MYLRFDVTPWDNQAPCLDSLTVCLAREGDMERGAGKAPGASNDLGMSLKGLTDLTCGVEGHALVS